MELVFKSFSLEKKKMKKKKKKRDSLKFER